MPSKALTPCINVCVLQYGVCTGCKRTSKQIKNWITYTEEQRRQIMKGLKEAPNGKLWLR